MDGDNRRIKVAVLGSGNIGCDLMYKLLNQNEGLELILLAGIDPKSDGLARARSLGLRTSHEGIKSILDNSEIKIVFDATSAKAHLRHAQLLRESGRIVIDLTPAALGPGVVPPVNLGIYLNELNINLITCGGQATIPLVHAVSRVTPVAYAEIVSTIASRSAGPGTRQNIDEFTFATAKGLETLGGAKMGKAIIILNPAEPPIIMRNTVYVVPERKEIDRESINDSLEQMVKEVQNYVPGYHMKNPPVYDRIETSWGTKPAMTILLEVKGAGDYLPEYAGNLDIMTSAAYRVGKIMAEYLQSGQR